MASQRQFIHVRMADVEVESKYGMYGQVALVHVVHFVVNRNRNPFYRSIFNDFMASHHVQRYAPKPCLWTLKLLDSGSEMMGKQELVGILCWLTRLLWMTHNNTI
jgi:hypothetical protein